MRATLDASVWLSATSKEEAEHLVCASVIEKLVSQRVSCHQPSLFAVEVCATIARRTRNRQLAIAAREFAIGLPLLTSYVLDDDLAAEASEVAATCALRGADAVYVATARRAGSVLITLDSEILARATSVATVLTPREWLSA